MYFLNRQRLVYLKNKLTGFYARNFPTNYKDEYSFREQWEEAKQGEREQPQMTLLEEAGVGYLIFALAVMTVLVWVIWVMSYERFF